MKHIKFVKYFKKILIILKRAVESLKLPFALSPVEG